MGNYCNKLTKKYNNDEVILIKWNSKDIIEKYHFWPVLDIGGDNINNNLFAKKGVLDKYDSLFETESLKYQINNHCISSSNTNNDDIDSGFYLNAAILSSLYTYPKYDVNVSYKNKLLKFTPKEIEGLMIICSNNSINKNLNLEFKFNLEFHNNENRLFHTLDDRFNIDNNSSNDYSGDSQTINDNTLKSILPLDMLEIFKILSRQDKPFIIKFEGDNNIWYAYDSIEIIKTSKCDFVNSNFNLEKNFDKNSKTYFYNFKINSSKYSFQNIDIWGYVNIISYFNGTKMHNIYKQGWIENYQIECISLKYPYLNEWSGYSYINPHINSQIVYNIYKYSLIKNNFILQIFQK